MSGLQICGKQAKKPYYIKNLNKNVYSLEEINYFIYNYLDKVYRDFFSEELFDYIENELECVDIAKHMRKMHEEGKAKTKDFINFLLEVSRYYDSRELLEIQVFVDIIDSMSKAERMKLEADKYFRQEKYASALKIYGEILANREKDRLGNYFYGLVAYTTGVIYARLYLSKTANSYFSQAYSFDPDPKYAKACVYMSLVNNDEEEILNAIINYKITDEQLVTMRAAVNAARTEIENSEKTRAFFADLENRTKQKDFIDNWKQEYYNMQS